ncbi:MAG: methyltransferase, partial [Myxococcaceae bacterium]
DRARVELTAGREELARVSPDVARYAAAVSARWEDARWQSESGAPAPSRVAPVDDRMTADQALRRLSQGEHLLYQGDFRNAKQLLDALGRRLKKTPRAASSLSDAFRTERDARWREATTLGRLVVLLTPELTLRLTRAPDVRCACEEAWGSASESKTPTLVSLRELLGVLGAAEWRKKGIELPPLGARIHPHYGVFSPTRSEYLDLLPGALSGLAVLEVGTGTGVLACLLAKRGATEVVATDLDPRAVACAAENAERLGLSQIIRTLQADLFPPSGVFERILFNPPWIPERPRAPIDRAIYDEGGVTLVRFLAGASAYLAPGGEVWLIMSDLAERLQLRPAAWLGEQFSAHGWTVSQQESTPARHGRAQDKADPLHKARSEEQTSLYRLRRA